MPCDYQQVVYHRMWKHCSSLVLREGPSSSSSFLSSYGGRMILHTLSDLAWLTQLMILDVPTVKSLSSSPFHIFSSNVPPLLRSTSPKFHNTCNLRSCCMESWKSVYRCCPSLVVDPSLAFSFQTWSENFQNSQTITNKSESSKVETPHPLPCLDLAACLPEHLKSHKIQATLPLLVLSM